MIGHLTTIAHPISLDSAVVDHRPVAWGELTIKGKTGTILIDESERKIKFESTFSEKDLNVPKLTSLGADLKEANESA